MDHLTNVFQEYEATLNGLSGNAVHEFRKRSFDSLKQVQFPDRKHEDWKYTAVQKLISPKYKVASSPPPVHATTIAGVETYVISIINGKVDLKDLDPEIANKGLRIISLQDAIDDPSWKEAFSKRTGASAISSGSAFDLLNFSFSSSGLFIDIPRNTVLDKAIEFRIIHEDPEISFSHPLFFMRCGQGSRVKMIERYLGNESGFSSTNESLINSLGYIQIDKNASLSHVKWQNIPLSQHLVYKLFVIQFRDSRFETFAFDYGGSLVRNNVEVELEENNTYTSLHGAYIATGKQNMDHQTRINHKVAYCESHELYKGIIDGQASAAFNGKVFVHKDAQKTNAYQQNDTLVLSPFAVMNSKPQLEIYADDVKCSHGATIGQLDQQAMFYLRSRGIDASTAKHILKEAFLAEVIEKLPDENLRDYITSQMSIGS